jgi:dihydropteroate synthase
MTSDLTPIYIGDILFDFSRPYIMGVLNVTPDSFSDGGNFFARDKAIEHALRMQDEGADIIDIGGESTRPGSKSVSVEEELSRVIPVIEGLRSRLTVPVSIDTAKKKVAEEALNAGAAMINDITGLHGDSGLAELAAARDVPIVVMHIKGTPRTMQKNPEYKDLIAEISAYLQESINIAVKAGLEKSKIIIDPGIGFGKTYEHNFELIRNLGKFEKFGLPIMVGASRKRFLATDEKYPENERLEQSIAAASAAVLNGANFVRVHDVAPTRKALWVISKIKFSG